MSNRWLKVKCMLCGKEEEIPGPYMPKGWYCLDCMARSQIAFIRQQMSERGIKEFVIRQNDQARF